MIRVSLAACVALSLAACGPSVPQHAGYKSKSPWKKAKPISLAEGNQGKAKGELDYADYKRARWYTVELPSDGTLDVAMQYQPLDDAGSSTVALEVYDAGFSLLSEDEDAPVAAAARDGDGDEDDDADGGDDEDEGEDADDDEGSGETQKQRSLPGLAAGRYYVHLFVTGRMDSAEFEVQATFTPVALPRETDFPRQVAWLPALPIVPLEDDGPPPEKVTSKPSKGGSKGGGKKPATPPPADDAPASTGAVQAIVISVAAGSSGAVITINAGTNAGLAAGRKGTLAGVKNGAFTLSSCGERTCKASVSATVDEVNKSGMQVTVK
jgi:hypothetical protein